MDDIVTLVYELLDAHDDTAQLAAKSAANVEPVRLEPEHPDRGETLPSTQPWLSRPRSSGTQVVDSGRS